MTDLYTFIQPQTENPFQRFLIDNNIQFEGTAEEFNTYLKNRNLSRIIRERWQAFTIIQDAIRFNPQNQVYTINFKLKNRVSPKLYNLIINEISWLFQSKTVSFPWIRLFTNTDSQKLMENLRKFEPTLTNRTLLPHNVRFSTNLPLNFRGKFLSILHSPEEYKNIDLLTDLYQENNRLLACRQDQKCCPLNRFYNETRDLVAESFRKTGGVTMEGMRQISYQRFRECTQFKPSLVLSIVQILGGTRMLDFSAGWGDRLVGAIAAGLDRYQGYDPNINLKSGHTAMIQELARQPDKYSVEYIGFEYAPIEPNGFDLIFTSPPFFDFEIYTNDLNQSVAMYPGFTDWLVKFLFGSMQKAWNSLCIDGHMVIHITDVYKTKVSEVMILLALSRLYNISYEGVINSIGENKLPRPMWVFKKIQNTNINIQKQAAEDLKKFYPDLYNML